MNCFLRLTSLLLLILVISSCQKPTEVGTKEASYQQPAEGGTKDAQKSRVLPTSIDYHAEGTLAHLVYRAMFEYNASNQLLSVRDSLLDSWPTNQSASPWVQFSYTNNQLARVDLRALSNDLSSSNYGYTTAHVELTYSDQTANARLIIDNQEVQKASFALDGEGYPVKSNVSLGQLLLDSQGHLDYLAESNHSKAQNPDNFFEVLEQQYDQDRNVFSESKEYQILAAILAVFNRDVNSTTGLVGLDNPLTNNNLMYRTVRRCSTLFGCSTGKLVSETQQVNSLGFPTQRSAPVGAMGIFYYTITYKQTN